MFPLTAKNGIIFYKLQILYLGPVCPAEKIDEEIVMDFVEFGLDERLLKGIEAAGYVSCTPVQ